MAKTVGRLKQGDMLIAGEINERLPAVRNGLIAHLPFDETEKKYIPNKIRYIRDYLNGSTVNPDSHWVEIQAIDYDGVNVALNKAVTSNKALTYGTAAQVVDGDTATANFVQFGQDEAAYVQVDLGALFNVEQIKVWHYYGDGRTYHNTKTEVSEDGNTWYPIFDSLIEGTYAETSTGKIHRLQFLGSTVDPAASTNVTLLPRGVVVEEATSNMIEQPIDLTNVYWTKHNSTAEHNLMYGLTKITQSTTAATLHAARRNISYSASSDYSFSFKLKKGSARYFMFITSGYTNWWNGNGNETIIDMNDFSVVRSSAKSYNVERISDDTAIVSIYATVASENNITSDLYLAHSDGVDATMDGDGKTFFYVGEVQVEKKLFSTSLANVSRSADAKLSYRHDMTAPVSVSLKYTVDTQNELGNRKYLFSFDNDNNTSNYFALYHSDGKLILESSSSYASISQLSATVSLLNGSHTITATLDSTAMKLYVDGVEVGSLSSPVLPAKTSYLKIGNAQNLNLLTNGSAQMGSNTNFPSFTYSTTDASDGDAKSFYITSGSTSAASSEFMPVDPAKRYRLEGDFKMGDDLVQSRFYYGLYCYDENKSFIGHQEVTHYSNTRTTLAQDLVDGATTVYLTSSANWQVGTAGSTAYNKLFATWPSGWRYPKYTRSKHAVNYLTVDATAHTLTLQSAWNGGTIPAGTPVANSYHGGTYNYIAASNALTTSTWTRYAGEIQGLGGGSGGIFRWGTKYVRLMFLLNRDATNPTTKIDNMTWYELSSNSPANNIIKDVSIYNRVLNSQEAKKLHANTFSITKVGDVNSAISEKPNDLPVGATSFSLGTDSLDKYKAISPTTESNIVYENGSIWSGDSVTNLFTGEKSNLGAGATTVIEDEWEKVTVTTANHGRRYYVDLAKLTNGATYASSITAYNPNSSAISITVDWCDTGATSYTIQPFETRRIDVISSRATYDSTYRFFDVILSTTGEYWVKNTQIESGTFSTPYVIGTRNAAKLAYAPGIDFTKSWTFGVFTKPNLTALRAKDRNPFMELGSYYTAGETSIAVTSWDTTTNGIRIILTDNQTWPAVPGTHTFTNNDLSSWIFSVLRFDGSTLFYDSFALSGHHSTSAAKSWTHPIRNNVFVAGYGWADALNGHAKNFMYEQRFIPTSDLQSIYKTQMRAYKDNRLQVQGQVREGKVL